MAADVLIDWIESTVRSDPARRGLLGNSGFRLEFGSISRSASSLLKATSVALMTGFAIPAGDGSAKEARAETDGPMGTVLLATVLRELGIEVRILTDRLCESSVRFAAVWRGFSNDEVLGFPHTSDADRVEFLASGFGLSLSHLVAVERCGPSHTTVSIDASEPDLDERRCFREMVADEWQDRCCNMRGEVIDRFCGDLHKLFDDVQQSGRAVATIGIGDGGNEIGMGKFRWSLLRRLLHGPQANWIPCRIACDETIVSGTSNWGAYALAAAVAVLADRTDILKPFTVDSEYQLLQRLVSESGAVDGVTRLSEPTVDGLPFLTYIQPWAAIRKALGFEG